MSKTDMVIHGVGQGMQTSDGDGVNIYRVLSPQGYNVTDPFLMLDEIRSDKSADFIGGFPEHPHRGFDTITFMFDGGFEHQDSLGNKDVISSGGVQRMKTGSGIRHSEMPVPDAQNRIHGFQLWLNVPAAQKMLPPAYEDADPTNIPVIGEGTGASIRLIAGKQQDAVGRWYEEDRQLTIMDIALEEGQTVSVDEIPGKRGIVYIVDGAVTAFGQNSDQAETHAKKGEFILFDSGNHSRFYAKKTARLLYLSGHQINEQIAHYGPFVMNSEDEIHQAIRDFQSGKF